MITRQLKASLNIGILAILLVANLGCGEFKSTDALIRGIEERVSLDYIGPNEPTYCNVASPTIYPNAYTITGTASFEYREIEYSSNFRGLGAVSETPKPIRRAEFVVLNNVGVVIQCGETDIDGEFSFTVPQSGQVYRLQIRSRADNTAYRVSVLRSPESNQIYVLERAFSASSNQNLQLVASATGNVLGGAFHILDEIYNYNERLRTLAGTCPAMATGCLPFTVAPKVQIYWEAGFNPGSYLPGSPGTSFYYPSLQRLFLLGGINGDVDFTDTDHFDRSIIAHEYFHFLEDVFSRTSSPGGAHNGNQLIDPRLAWSEGIAQFFQAVMTGIPRVLDTIGNSDGASQMIVDYSVEEALNDIPNALGEGEFREFSVARFLWDMHDDTPGETSVSGVDCTTPVPTNPTLISSPTAGQILEYQRFENSHDNCIKDNFIRIWGVLTGNDGLNGFANHRFISSSLFLRQYERNRNANVRTQNILPLRNYEFQNFVLSYSGDITTINYGQRMVATGCAAPELIKMRTPFVPSQTPGLANSHFAVNSRYFYIQHGGGPLAVELNSGIESTNGLTAQADIYLYSENYRFIGDDPIALNLANVPLKAMSTSEILPAGFYMIVVNVRNFNAGSGAVTLRLRAGATTGALGNLCLSN